MSRLGAHERTQIPQQQEEVHRVAREFEEVKVPVERLCLLILCVNREG